MCVPSLISYGRLLTDMPGTNRVWSQAAMVLQHSVQDRRVISGKKLTLLTLQINTLLILA